MGKLTESAKKHRFATAFFQLGEDSHELKIKLFSSSKYKEVIEKVTCEDDEVCAAEIATLFMDPETLEPALTAEDILSDNWTTHDLSRLLKLFMDVNSGTEGN
jgi:hypothetical protein